MKTFDYIDTPKALLTPDIVAMLTSIHEHRGKQDLYIDAHSDSLTNFNGNSENSKHRRVKPY